MKKVLAAAVLVLSIVAALSIVSVRRESADAEWVEHTQTVLQQLETTLRYATEARRAANAYVITGDVARLRRCVDAERQTEISAGRVAALTRDNPAQQQRIREFQRLLVEEHAALDQVTSTRDAALVRAPGWSGRFANLQAAVDAMKNEEQRLLEIRNREEDASVRRAQIIVAGGNVVAFALVLAFVAISASEGRRRRAAESRLAAMNQQLTYSVADLTRRSAELAQLSRFGRLLQSCENHEELGAVVRSVFPQLFPESRGGAYLTAASRNLLMPIAAWPDESAAAPFPPSDCWALRGGVMHKSVDGLHCKHGVEPRSVCIPLMAQGEALGLLHVRVAEEESIDVASAAAEQLSLAAATVNMQETLRRQAMRDPLTGLFNRRYMEETLEREVHRAARQKSMIGVLVLDLDRFKAYNDTVGHIAGDELLRSAAGIMQRAVRAEDVVCRYGGDEFVVIMPDASVEGTEQRARDLHKALDQLPPPVTASIGVAVFPLDGTAGKDLLSAADSALYGAKRAGRARVVRANSRDAAASGH